MSNLFKKSIAIILILSLLSNSGPFIMADTIGDGSASGWAETDLQKAIDYGLTYDGLLSHFKSNITREEFSIIVVKLYEKLTDQIATYGTNPFNDTTNPEILKAYQLGIVNGVGQGQFKPGNLISRQDLCTMLVRALVAAFPALDTSSQPLTGYIDANQIGSWAKAGVEFCKENGIINGISTNQIAPLGNTTREQAIILIMRTYENFKVTIPDDPAAAYEHLPIATLVEPIMTISSESYNFNQLDWENRLTSPAYDSKVDLYISTDEEKPSILPGSNSIYQLITIGSATYSNSPFTLVNSGENLVRHFSYVTKGITPSKIVWQVSKTAFNGYLPDSDTLVASGEVTGTSKEFTIDFGEFNETKPLLLPIFTSASGGAIELITAFDFNIIQNLKTAAKPIPMAQKIYYVRAFGIDSGGNPLGDPGAGMPVIYGKPTLDSHMATTISSTFELWSTLFSGPPNTGGEHPNAYTHLPSLEQGVTPVDGVFYYKPENYSSKAQTITLQVTTVPFSNLSSDWQAPEGLVYHVTYDTNNMPSINGTANSFGINFKSFSPTDLGTNKIKYYVRFVTTQPSQTQQGALVPSISETKVVVYSNPDPVEFYETVTQIVPAKTPTLDFQRYIPVSWENSDWEHYFEVFRAPKWNEVNFKLKKSNGDILYPYGYYALQGVTATEYENTIVPRFLVEGSTFKVVVSSGDSSWWGDLWDGIVDFFKSIVNLVKDIVNWVGTTYANLKSDLISFVAQNFILIPEGWRDELEIALTAFVDAGLASMGIPPSLPNFDELMEQGLDYAVTVALEEAGIPASVATFDVKEALKQEIRDAASSSTKVEGPNPLNCAFIRPASDYMYRPAYIDVRLHNEYGTASPNGSLSIRIEGKAWPYYPVYDYESIPIPQIEPYKYLDIRVYLTEYVNKPYPGGGIFTPSTFSDLYWDQACTFNITANFNLPNVKTKAIELGLDQGHEKQIVTYEYDHPARYYAFTNTPKNSAY